MTVLELFYLIQCILTIFLAQGYNLSDYCSLKRERHVSMVCKRKIQYCKPDPFHCGETTFTGLSKTEIDEVLHIHNQLRNEAAAGSEKRGGLEEASNMNALSYSNELAYSAQCLANSCIRKYDQCKMTPKYSPFGQNLYFSRGGNETISTAVQSWYDEIEKYKRGPNFVHSEETERFTQVVWASTSLLGCGQIRYHGHKVLVCCNYGLAGNGEGQLLFKPGKPCSNCPRGVSCGTRYKSLCGDVKKPDENFEPPFMHKSAFTFLGGNQSPKTSKINIFMIPYLLPWVINLY